MKLIEKLRDSTKEQHANLDQISEMKQLTSESVGLNDYKNYLLAFYSIYESIEKDIYDHSTEYIKEIRANQRLSTIKNDLKQFGVDSKYRSHLLQLDNNEYLGALYVMEGSRLGGSLIGKHLLKNLDIDKDNLQFLFSSPTIKWSQIISVINEQPAEKHVEIITGAQKVFKYFYDELHDFYKGLK